MTKDSTHNSILLNKAWQWLFIISLLCIFTLPAQAAIPDNVDYQGYLTDSGGSPITGTVSITFSLYNIDTGGIALWTDTQSVTLTNGLFTVELGRVASPFPLGLFDAPLWLAIDVASDGEMAPRIAFSSAGFAHKADDALTLEGQSASSLDQSAHVTDTGNPHSVTAAQAGAVSSANFSLHTGDASAHHTKTTSFPELSGQIADAQIPVAITRDSELASHSAVSDAHHTKTSVFTELSGQASNAQIPAAIARDSEIMPTVFANDGPGSGLNADLLDGLNSTAFMSAGTDNWVNTTGDAMTGNLSVMARVGIGTATPTHNLEVVGGVYNYLGYFYNDNNATGNAYGLYALGDARGTGTGGGRGAVFYGYGGSTSGIAYGTANFAFAYGTSRAYGVYSDADGGTTTGREWAFYGIGDSYFSGDVGIGTSTPASKLAVSGGATVGSAYNANTLSDGYLAVSGNVGIGTSTPGSKLAVSGGATVGSAYNANTLSNGYLAVSGNVGIGTAAPTRALDVRGGAPGYLGYFWNDNNVSGNAYGIYARGDAYGTGTGVAYGGYFRAHGGSTSGNAQGVQSYSQANGTSTSYGVYSHAMGGNTTGREWAFYGWGDSYFSGDVGIGTSNPGYKLEVYNAAGTAPLMIRTPTGTGTMGAENTGYFHFYTDRPAFYFDKQVQCNGGCVTYSDIDKKEDLEPVTAALEKIAQLNGVTWSWKEKDLSRARQMGLIAQNVEEVAPELVEDTMNGKTMNYDGLSALTVEAIKELIAENKTLKEEIRNIKAVLGL